MSWVPKVGDRIKTPSGCGGTITRLDPNEVKFDNHPFSVPVVISFGANPMTVKSW